MSNLIGLFLPLANSRIKSSNLKPFGRNIVLYLHLFLLRKKLFLRNAICSFVKFVCALSYLTSVSLSLLT